MKNKTVFAIGDRVFDLQYGWGEIFEIHYRDLHLRVNFDINVKRTYDFNGYQLSNQLSFPTLSFTEYKLEGFTQERPEILPNEGDIVWIKEDEDQYYWQIGHFYKKIDNRYLISSGRPGGWSLSGVVMTTENPYTNEHRNKN